MISLSSFSKMLVAGAVMAATPTVSTAQACQGAGCVLPLPAPAAPPVVQAPPPPVEAVPVEAAPVAARGGFSLLPILLGLAALAALAYLLLDDKDDDERPVSP